MGLVVSPKGGAQEFPSRHAALDNDIRNVVTANNSYGMMLNRALGREPAKSDMQALIDNPTSKAALDDLVGAASRAKTADAFREEIRSWPTDVARFVEKYYQQTINKDGLISGLGVQKFGQDMHMTAPNGQGPVNQQLYHEHLGHPRQLAPYG